MLIIYSAQIWAASASAYATSDVFQLSCHNRLGMLVYIWGAISLLAVVVVVTQQHLSWRIFFCIDIIMFLKLSEFCFVKMSCLLLFFFWKWRKTKKLIGHGYSSSKKKKKNLTKKMMPERALELKNSSIKWNMAQQNEKW